MVWASSDDGALSINQLLVTGKHCITWKENANSKHRSVINKREGRSGDDRHESFAVPCWRGKREQAGQLTKAWNRYLARKEARNSQAQRGGRSGQGKAQAGAGDRLWGHILALSTTVTLSKLLLIPLNLDVLSRDKDRESASGAAEQTH